MLETLAAIAGILGGVAILVAFIRWLIRILRKPEETLSPSARQLLLEIVACTTSDPKGVSLLKPTATKGHYLPYLHDADPPSRVPIRDLSPIMAAVSEIERAGYIEFHSAEGSVEEYRRTLKQVRV